MRERERKQQKDGGRKKGDESGESDIANEGRPKAKSTPGYRNKCPHLCFDLIADLRVVHAKLQP